MHARVSAYGGTSVDPVDEIRRRRADSSFEQEPVERSASTVVHDASARIHGGGGPSEGQPPPKCYLRALADQMEDEVELSTCRVPVLEIH